MSVALRCSRQKHSLSSGLTTSLGRGGSCFCEVEGGRSVRQWAYCRGCWDFTIPTSPLACLSSGRETLGAESGSSGHGLKSEGRKSFCSLLISCFTPGRCEVACVISSFPSVSVPSRWCLSLWNSVWEANCTSSFEKVPSVVCMFRIFLWVFDRVGYCSLHFFSCSPIIGYVDCWWPACFYFSLLLDAHSKLWLSLAEKDFRGCFLPQRHFFSSHDVNQTDSFSLLDWDGVEIELKGFLMLLWYLCIFIAFMSFTSFSPIFVISITILRVFLSVLLSHFMVFLVLIFCFPILEVLKILFELGKWNKTLSLAHVELGYKVTYPFFFLFHKKIPQQPKAEQKPLFLP